MWIGVPVDGGIFVVSCGRTSAEEDGHLIIVADGFDGQASSLNEFCDRHRVNRRRYLF
jgi:hypothetical protein